MFSVAIGSMVGRVWFSKLRAVVSDPVVVEPIVMVSRCARVVKRRGHVVDLNISEGFGVSP